MAPAQARKILVIQTAFLGDIVLTSAFLANLRELCPKAEILFLTTPIGARVFTPNAFGISILPFDKRGKDRGFGGFMRMSRKVREFAPDVVFCLHRSLRSTLLARVSGGETWGFLDAAGSVLFNRRVKRIKGLYDAEKNQQMLVEWAGSAAEKQNVYPKLVYSGEEKLAAAAALSSLEKQKFFAMVPSSVWATKRWPAARFADTALQIWKKHGLRAVVIGGSEAADVAVAEEVVNAFRSLDESAPLPLNLAGKTSIGSMKAVLEGAKFVVANDTAPLHVAIAMGVPVVGVFGPTTKEIGFFPNAPEGMASVVEVNGLSCRPCGLHGHHKCPLGHFKCMLELTPEAVMVEVEKFLCRQ